MAIIHSGNFHERGDHIFAKITNYKSLLSDFKSETRNGVTSKTSSSQMKAYSISEDTDLDDVCPDTKVAALKSIAFLQNINIDTSKLNKAQLDMLYNIINPAQKPQLADDGSFYPGNSSGPVSTSSDNVREDLPDEHAREDDPDQH